MCNKTLPTLARKYPPYKNRIPPAPEVSLCLELACSRVLWSVLSLNKSALSLFLLQILCVFGSILHPWSPKTWFPVPTCDVSICCSHRAAFLSQGERWNISVRKPPHVSMKKHRKFKRHIDIEEKTCQGHASNRCQVILYSVLGLAK